MRINKYIASASGLSRRAVDDLISQGRVKLNGQIPAVGQDVTGKEKITIDGDSLTPSVKIQTIMLHKPIGYVTSRDGQGSQTIYDILPKTYHILKPVGRLDKDSSGLLLLTNDGQLANQMTHPRYGKTKIYEVKLDKGLQPLHQQMIADHGIKLEDGLSRFTPQKLASDVQLRIVMSEGRNRQIRRTFEALGYKVVKLHRTDFGPFSLGSLKAGKTLEIKNNSDNPD